MKAVCAHTSKYKRKAPVGLAVTFIVAAGLIIAAAAKNDDNDDDPNAAAAVAESVKEHKFHLSR